MRRFSGILVLCFLVSAAGVGARQQEPTAPVVPVEARIEPVMEEPKAPSNDVAALHDYLLKLKAEREALAIEQTLAKQQVPGQTGSEGQDITQMRRRLGELISKLTAAAATKKGAESSGSALPPAPGTTEKGKQGGPSKQKQANVEKGPGKANPEETLEAGMPTDSRALASVLFKSGNFEFALKAYRTVNLTGMRPDDRAPLQYLMATCLRKMGKIEEAAGLYREVANMRGDEQVSACAQWQLVYLRWRSEFEAQLKDLRERCQALEAPP